MIERVTSAGTRVVAAATAAAMLIAARSTALADTKAPCGPPVSVAPFLANGYMVASNHRSNPIVYGSRGASGLYELHLVNPDGTNDVRLGANNAEMPRGHAGSPSW